MIMGTPQSFIEFEATDVNVSEKEAGHTDSYEPPKYLVKPACNSQGIPDDRGFFYVKSEFDKLNMKRKKNKFKPAIYLY